MRYWLLKTEPSVYAYQDLVRDGRTVWDGVTNNLALKHLRAMEKGDRVVIYHTGGERAAVGIADVVSNPYPDPRQQDERRAVVDLKAGQALPRAVTLDQIRNDKAFEGWDLLRISRLSVVPTPAPMWRRLLETAGVPS